MLIDALPEPTPLAQLTPHEGELRYVTQHFKDLQGLRLVPFALTMLVLLAAVPRGHKSGFAIIFFMSTMVALSAGGYWCSTRWYKARYGLVQVAALRKETVPGFGLATTLFFATVAGLVIFAHGPQPFVSTAALIMNCFLPQCFFTAPCSNLVQLRHFLYSISTLAIIGSAIAAAFSVTYHWIAYDTLLWGLLLLGLYDHWLLLHLLRPRRPRNAEALHD